MKTEALILKERAQAQQYLDVAGVMIAVLDKNGKINLINKKGCQILGYDENEILHQNWFDLCIHDDIREDIVGVFNELMTGNIEPIEDFENPIITKSGEKKIIAFHNTLITDDDSNITGILFSGEDITERKHADEALRESEEKLRTIFDASPDVIHLLDINGIILSSNKGFAKRMGLEIDNVVGKNVFDYCPTESVPNRKAAIEKVFRTGEPLQLEDIGLTGIFESHVHPVFNPAGEVTAVAVYARDITERKHAEEALLQSEIKYRTLVEHIPAITYIAALDESSTTLYVSPQIETILGISPADYKADPDFWVKHLHPDDRERVMDEMRRCHESDQFFISEYRMVSKDGRLVWFSDDAVIVKDDKGKPLYLQGIMYDITERKRAEEALKKEKNTAQNYLDIAGSIMLALDVNGKVTLMNKKGCEILGYSKEEIIGKDWFQTFLPERMREEVKEIFNRIMNGEIKELENVDGFSVISKSGKEISLFWCNSIITDENNNIIGTLSSGEDITERKKAGEELQERMNELETFYRTTLGREERVIELKQEVNQLLEQLGKNKKYKDYS